MHLLDWLGNRKPAGQTHSLECSRVPVKTDEITDTSSWETHYCSLYLPLNRPKMIWITVFIAPLDPPTSHLTFASLSSYVCLGNAWIDAAGGAQWIGCRQLCMHGSELIELSHGRTRAETHQIGLARPSSTFLIGLSYKAEMCLFLTPVHKSDLVWK